MEPERRTQHPGRGPRGYVRSDERIREDVCELLSAARVDVSRVRVSVEDGVVILDGRIRDRGDRQHLERLVDTVRGVRDIDDRLRVAADDFFAEVDPELHRGIFKALVDDHHAISSLFDDLIGRRGDTDRRGRLAVIARDLIAHARAEQEVFYPTLEAAIELGSEVRKSQVEHALVEHLLGELDAIRDETPEWMTRVEVLQDLVQHHAYNEQLKVFPKALRLLDPAQSDALAERFTAVRDRQLAILDDKTGPRTGPSHGTGAPAGASGRGRSARK